jgi:hypothetical protein
MHAVCDIDVGPVTFFLDIVELGSTNYDGIVLALTDCLTANGLTEEFLRYHWIGLSTDGASVMLGIKSGVAAKLTISFPGLILWHCFNHRLELAVSDAVNHARRSLTSKRSSIHYMHYTACLQNVSVNWLSVQMNWMSC